MKVDANQHKNTSPEYSYINSWILAVYRRMDLWRKHPGTF